MHTLNWMTIKIVLCSCGSVVLQQFFFFFFHYNASYLKFAKICFRFHFFFIHFSYSCSLISTKCNYVLHCILFRLVFFFRLRYLCINSRNKVSCCCYCWFFNRYLNAQWNFNCCGYNSTEFSSKHLPYIGPQHTIFAIWRIFIF